MFKKSNLCDVPKMIDIANTIRLSKAFELLEKTPWILKQSLGSRTKLPSKALREEC